MKLVFIGPQGCGKGTQAKRVSEELGLTHLSSGDLLRSATGELRKEIDSYIIKGNLVPDELIIRLIKERITKNDCDKGIILDGFPRNIKQAKELEKIINIDKYIEIHISDSEAVKRISGRRSCNKCEKIYNIFTAPKPKKENTCDTCNIELNMREDDTKEAVKKRLKIYHEETEQIIKEYQTIKINGEQEIPEVTKEILSYIKE